MYQATDLGRRLVLDEAVQAGEVGIPCDAPRKDKGEAAEALDYLNLQKDIQHRDVKPLNRSAAPRTALDTPRSAGSNRD